MCGGGGGGEGGGGTLIFHIYVGLVHFWGFKILNFNIFFLFFFFWGGGGFRKNIFIRI